MAKQGKDLRNPYLACEGQSNKKTNRETETYKCKEKQGRGILFKRNKKNRNRLGWIRVSRLEYACAYIGPVYAAQLYVYAYFEYAYACRRHAYTRGELPPSFCNGLGTIYIVSIRGRAF